MNTFLYTSAVRGLRENNTNWRYQLFMCSLRLQGFFNPTEKNKYGIYRIGGGLEMNFYPLTGYNTSEAFSLGRKYTSDFLLDKEYVDSNVLFSLEWFPRYGRDELFSHDKLFNDIGAPVEYRPLTGDEQKQFHDGVEEIVNIQKIGR